MGYFFAGEGATGAGLNTACKISVQNDKTYAAAGLGEFASKDLA